MLTQWRTFNRNIIFFSRMIASEKFVCRLQDFDRRQVAGWIVGIIGYQADGYLAHWLNNQPASIDTKRFRFWGLCDKEAFFLFLFTVENVSRLNIIDKLVYLAEWFVLEVDIVWLRYLVVALTLAVISKLVFDGHYFLCIRLHHCVDVLFYWQLT
jgi:hypothetical protein